MSGHQIITYDGCAMAVIAPEDLKRLEMQVDVLHEIANHGCGLSKPGIADWQTCEEQFPDRDMWCWSCIAHEALKEG